VPRFDAHLPVARRAVGSLPHRRLVLAAWAPHAVSLLGVGFCIAAGVLLAVGGSMLAAGALFLAGGACDALDGFVARRMQRHHSQSGAFMDSMCDKVGEAALLGGLVVAVDDRLAIGLLIGAYALGSLSSYVKATAGEHCLEIEWPEVRVFGRAGRVLLLSATLLLAGAAGEGHVLVLNYGFAALFVFNATAFGWRLARVASAGVEARRARHDRGRYRLEESVLPFRPRKVAPRQSRDAHASGVAARR